MEIEFKVIVYAISGKPKRMFYKGETVKESQLNRSADELVRGEYIEPIESEVIQEVAEVPAEEVIVDEAPTVEVAEEVEVDEATPESKPEDDILFTVELNGKNIEVREENDITKKEVAQALEDLNIEFDTTKNKATLFALLLDHFTV